MTPVAGVDDGPWDALLVDRLGLVKHQRAVAVHGELLHLLQEIEVVDRLLLR
jgi:hypothetical protein